MATLQITDKTLEEIAREWPGEVAPPNSHCSITRWDNGKYMAIIRVHPHMHTVGIGELLTIQEKLNPSSIVVHQDGSQEPIQGPPEYRTSMLIKVWDIAAKTLLGFIEVS